MTRLCTPFSIIRQHCPRWVDQKSTRHSRNNKRHASWAARPGARPHAEIEIRHDGGEASSVKRIDQPAESRSNDEGSFYPHTAQSSTEEDDYSLLFLRSGKASKETPPQTQNRAKPNARQVKYVEKVTGYSAYTLAESRFHLPESARSTYDRRELLRHMTRDVTANMIKYEQGTLVPFSRPEYAYAAHEALLDCINMSLLAYRNSASDVVDTFQQVYQELHSIISRSQDDGRCQRRYRIFQTFKMLRQNRYEFTMVTRDVKDLVKVSHAIVSRDSLFSEHVTRLAAFKTSFHRVQSGWIDIKQIMYEGTGRFPRWVTAAMPSHRLSQYRSEISRAKFEVKTILDSRLRYSNLPLFHLKKAVDFYHDLLRVTSSVIVLLEDLRRLYYMQVLRGNPAYRGKWMCISAWVKRTNIETLEISAVYRALAFYVSAHVRAKYDYQPVEAANHLLEATDLPAYVRYGLTLQNHRDKQGPLPLPSIRPTSSGQFIDLPLLDTPYDEFIEFSQVEISEDTPDSFGADYQQNRKRMTDVVVTDNADVLPLDVLDTPTSWDDSDFPRVENISFPSSHDRLSNLRYGSMLERRKHLFDVAQANPFDDEILESTGSSIAAYAALYREKGSYSRGQNLRSPSPGVTERRLLSPELVKPWQPSFQQRSRSRPNNYGALLQRFQGLATGHEVNHPTTDIIRVPRPPVEEPSITLKLNPLNNQNEPTQKALQSSEDTAVDVFVAAPESLGNTLLTQETFLDSMVNTVLQREARAYRGIRRLNINEIADGSRQSVISNDLKSTEVSRDSYLNSRFNKVLLTGEREHFASHKQSSTNLHVKDREPRSVMESSHVMPNGLKRVKALGRRQKMSEDIYAHTLKRGLGGEGASLEPVRMHLQNSVRKWRDLLAREQGKNNHSLANEEYVTSIEQTTQYWEAKLEELDQPGFDLTQSAIPRLSSLSNDQSHKQPQQADVPVAQNIRADVPVAQDIGGKDRNDLYNLRRSANYSQTCFELALGKKSSEQIIQTLNRNLWFWQAKLTREQTTLENHDSPLYLATIQDTLRFWQQKYDEYHRIPESLASATHTVGMKTEVGYVDPARGEDVVLEAQVESPSPLRVQIDNLREQIDGLQKIKLELERMHELEEADRRRELAHRDSKQFVSPVEPEQSTSASPFLRAPQPPPDDLLENRPEETGACPRCGAQTTAQQKSCFRCGRGLASFRRLQLDLATDGPGSSIEVDGTSLPSSEPSSYSQVDSDHTISCPRCYFGNQPTRSMCDQCGKPLHVSKSQRVLLGQDRRQQITQDIAVDALAEEVGPNLMAEFEQELARRKQDLKVLEESDEDRVTK